MKLIKLSMLLILSAMLMHSDFVGGTQTCPTSGAKQVSTTPYALYSVAVVPYSNNTGTITIGGSTVVASANTGLSPGDTFGTTKPNAGVNPSTLYMACTASGDSVWWIGTR